jgi:hypothetical protein
MIFFLPIFQYKINLYRAIWLNIRIKVFPRGEGFVGQGFFYYKSNGIDWQWFIEKNREELLSPGFHSSTKILPSGCYRLNIRI